ncbi:DUF624 domain-containing protein [Agromyces larvae]|uniref:DUF624 domain-containing protein n=1 Tax=Agromyces larvae TaxID=2929802 RepID=A0ABY4BZQ7_9MICO|nr:DUF624 domain-containing protein [Agromyces larvae]UOE44234.1 DUF624 domain-containing protein [Agromyces larvae]
MRIDPENRAIDGLSTFLAFVGLNLLFLLTCLPIVTIGAAVSALDEVTMRFADDERGRPFADYLPAFGRNFGRATLLALCLLVPAAALWFSGMFWLAYPEPLVTALAVIAFLACAYAVAAFLHAMALVAAYRNTFGRTLKNALLLPAAEPVRTLGIVLIPVTLVCLVVLFPPFIVIVATIGCSVGAYAGAFLFRAVHARH